MNDVQGFLLVEFHKNLHSSAGCQDNRLKIRSLAVSLVQVVWDKHRLSWVLCVLDDGRLQSETPLSRGVEFRLHERLDLNDEPHNWIRFGALAGGLLVVLLDKTQLAVNCRQFRA